MARWGGTDQALQRRGLAASGATTLAGAPGVAVFAVLLLFVGCRSTTPPAEPPSSAPSTPAAPSTERSQPTAVKAPADTRVLARVHVAALDPTTLGPVAGILEACDVAPADGLEWISAAVTERGGVVAEIDGSLDVKGARCLLARAGVEAEIAERAGGVRVSWRATEGPGAPAPLAMAMGNVAGDADLALVALLGPLDDALTVVATGQGGQARVRLGLGAPRAQVAAKALTTALARATERGAAELAGAQAMDIDGVLEVTAPATPAAAAALKRDVIETFSLPSASMLPTLWVGDKLIVAKGGGRPSRGDIIVYRRPDEGRAVYIKRVVALGEERVSWEDGTLHVDGHAATLSPLADHPALREVSLGQPWSDVALAARESLDGRSWSVLLPKREPLTSAPEPIVVPEGHVYVLGDNRDSSLDSRQHGTVPEGDVLGTAVGVWWSDGADGPRWERMGALQP